MWRWLVTAIIFICLIAVGIILEKPRGNLVGNVQLQSSTSKVFGTPIYTVDNIRKANARVVAYGQVTRASYVNSKGEFKITGLPVGNYTLSVKANGYETETKWGLEVKEAQDTKVQAVSLKYLTPSISVASDSRVFTTEEDPYLWFTSSAIENLDINLYSFDPMEVFGSPDIKKSDYGSFLLGNYYYGSADFVKLIIKSKEPMKTWNKKVVYDGSDYGRTPLKISEKLPQGSYIITVSGKGQMDGVTRDDAYWFTVSDLGIIVKQDANKVFLRAVNLKTLKSEPNVKVNIYNRYNEFNLLGSLTTNKQGLGEYVFSGENKKHDQSLFIVGQKENALAVNGSYGWYYDNDRYKMYFYTDRPVYRPDQTVYFKGILREEEHGELKNVAGQTLKITIMNPDDEPVKKFTLKTDRYGTYNAYVDMPKNAMLGSYTVHTELNSSDFYNYFELAEYRKPEYKVDVIPGSEMVIGGDKATATVKANYFFGYPVTNAKVKYTVYSSSNYALKWKLISRPEYYSFYDDWDEDENFYYGGYDYGNSSGDIIAEGYATTDENGEAKITFKTKTFKSDSDDYYGYDEYVAKTYKVEAEVTDISRKTAVGSGSFDVVSGEYALFIDSEYSVYTEDQDIKVDVESISYDKKPVSAEVNIELQGWDWDKDEWKYVNPKVVSKAKVQTEKDGKTTAILNIPKSIPTKIYRIVATSKDKKGHSISATSTVWVSNFRYPGYKSEVKPGLEVTLDKKVYQPGDTAKAMLVSPVKDVEAMVCLEGSELYNCQLVEIKDNTQLVEIPIKNMYVPNAYVSVIMVGPRKQYLSQTKLIKVSPDNNFLNISIQPDKTKYKPQDKVTYDIKVTDAEGKPVESELSLAVVDESIFSVREDYTPDIKKFFYNKRSNSVNTTYSFYKSYSAGADKMMPRVRKDFKDTAFWKADIVTDKNGRAKVSFTLPDNLTTWRATVRGVTEDTKVGSAIEKILVTKDIIVRIALPRFYTVGDQAILATIVHNYTDKDQTLRLELAIPSNFKVNGIKGKPVINVTIPPQDKVRQDWNVEARASGTVKVQASAYDPKNYELEGDAVEHTLEILPFGISKSEVTSGKVVEVEDMQSINHKITEKIVPGSLKWVVRVSPSNASMLLGSLDYLIQYPYGCTEQTMSRFMPSIVVANISRDLGIPLSRSAKAKLPEVVAESLELLYKNQHSDGGWGWWEYDESLPYMTTYVLHGLKYAVDSGYKIDQDRIKNALVWVEKHLASDDAKKISTNAVSKDSPLYYRESLTDLAYVCYVYALYGKRNDTILKNLYQIRDKLPNQGLAYLALAYAELDDSVRANKLIDTATSRVDITLPAIGFGMTKDLLERFGISLDSLYSYNDVEVTAIVMRAMMKVRPDDPLIEKMLPLMLEKRHGNYWYNTKTTAAVILTLSEYVKATAMSEDIDYTVVLKINNKELKTLHFTRSNVFSQESAIEIPAELIGQDNTVTIEKAGPGNMYYSSVFNYYQLYKPDEIISAKSDSDVVVTKEFYRLKAKTDADGNIVYDRELLKGPVQAGEVLLVKLVVDNTEFGQYMIAEDPKASGMEVVSDDPSSKLGSSFEDGDGDYWWNYWWTHQTDKDTHMAFFMTYLPKGKHEFYYLARPELPGEYLIRPTLVDGMYSSITSGSSTSFKLKVEE